jgi:hypothetical protein
MSEATREGNHLYAQRSSLAAPRNRLVPRRTTAAAAPVTAVAGPGETVCVECGRIDGRRGHQCLAHPRHPGMRTMAAAFFLAPLILVPVLGWDALLSFVPWFLFAWWVRSR